MVCRDRVCWNWRGNGWSCSGHLWRAQLAHRIRDYLPERDANCSWAIVWWCVLIDALANASYDAALSGIQRSWGERRERRRSHGEQACSAPA
ncbi:hypothetical protein KCP74_13770 [Salmonella enterica subsp. enterica]|nr:hypothetical protein KCP74_13770 [Salmonella enterica subsp. enterica]